MLGLVEIPPSVHAEESFYNEFTKLPVYKELQNNTLNGSIGLIKKVVSTTPLGDLFIKYCISD